MANLKIIFWMISFDQISMTWFFTFLIDQCNCVWSDWYDFVIDFLWKSIYSKVFERSVEVVKEMFWCFRNFSVHRHYFLTFRSAARYTKFRNLYYFDLVRRARLARVSSDDLQYYFQPTLWVLCYVSSFYLLTFLTLLPAVRHGFFLFMFFVRFFSEVLI